MLLGVGALGIVFGDLGTSPLYAMKTIFTLGNGNLQTTTDHIFGIFALVFWSLMVIVTFKYLSFIMRADNDGEGGILVLSALLRRSLKGRSAKLVTILGLIGAALFFGDSLITPAMSVMSAVEGTALITPQAAEFTVPAAIIILISLFSIQRFGTGKVSAAFGPIMLLWFLSIGILGGAQIIKNPIVLAALSPHYAISFALQNPVLTFGIMGGAVLAVTGAEALYADMGHFGAEPIRRAWIFLVFPCLAANYLGQAALILKNPDSLENPFFYLAPEPLRIPLIILATLATVIASQAVISGAFSVTAQAVNLGFLPRMKIRHTSAEASGQIYIPAVNQFLAIGITILILGFQSSEALSHAYGLAVTGTELLTTTLFAIFARKVLKWSWIQVVPFLAIILIFEINYFFANVLKIPSGGWLPLSIALSFFIVMTTWIWGIQHVAKIRRGLEISMHNLLCKLRSADLPRVPGQAIYVHPGRGQVPLALKENLRFNRVVHKEIVLVHTVVKNVPHVRHCDRISIERFGKHDQHLFDITISIGFNDSQNIPHNLKLCRGLQEGFVLDEENARYFVSVLDYQIGEELPWYLKWRRTLFMFLSKNAATHAEVAQLPRNRTALVGGAIYL